MRVFRYVVEQALYTAGEDFFFAFFGVITLHDTDTAQRFCRRPVTSALILGRSRKIGLMMLKALLKARRQRPAARVKAITVMSHGLIRSRHHQGQIPRS